VSKFRGNRGHGEEGASVAHVRFDIDPEKNPALAELVRAQRRGWEIEGAAVDGEGEEVSLDAFLEQVRMGTVASVVALNEAMNRLEHRKRDIDDMLSIMKSAVELHRKIQRLSQSLGGRG